jgi:hypothetical protein
MTENKYDYYDIDTDFYSVPFVWDCSQCGTNWKLFNTEDFTCDCGRILKFRFYRNKKEYITR